LGDARQEVTDANRAFAGIAARPAEDTPWRGHMTTVDLRIVNESSGERWSLHNGMNGPACTLGYEVWDELMAGRAEAIGPINVAQFSARLPGQLLADIVARVDLGGWAYAASTDVSVITAGIDVDATYRVELIEF
jgi:hypothetical protein